MEQRGTTGVGGTRPLRVAVLSAYYFPFQGGTETHARTAAVELARRGFAVRVITKRDDRGSSDFELLDGIPVHRIAPAGPRSGWRKWAMIPGAVARLVSLRRDYDLIYCPGYQGIGVAAIVAGLLLGRPVVLRSGNLGVLAGDQWDAPLRRWRISPALPPVRWLKATFQRLYMQADAFACNCRENEAEALRCGVAPARTYYLPNGVDVNRFHPAANGERVRVRREYGWPEEAFLWLYVGRLSAEKGVMELLEAWRQLECPGTLVLVGPDMHGHPWDAGPAARRFVQEHGLGHSVIFHGESVSADQLLRAADAYVLPSHYESFSNALVEAMATGLPVVATRIGGMLDCVDDGENGLLCTPRDPSDLARAMRRVMSSDRLAGELGARARATAVERFSQGAIMDRLADMLTGVMRRRLAPGAAWPKD